MAPHIGVTSVRARALYAIAQGTARVVIASAAAVLPRVTTPARMQAASLVLKPGQDISPIDLAELLVDAGFSREDPADEHGEFAIRGGIADVFPAGEAHPVRLEFIGDTIETLRTYDPSTQRSIAPIDQVPIVPLRDVLQDNRGATIFDYLARAGASRIIVSERDEVDASATKVLEQIQRSYEDIVGAEPARARGAASSVPAPAEIFVDWDTVASRFSQATTLAILGLDDSSREIRSQPAMELKGRVADWVAEIRRLRDEGESVLFVAATPGRAERTIELLKEYDVFAVPVERAEDARYAVVLVAVGALSRGFRLPDAGLQIYAEADVFEEERRAPERRRAATKAFLSDLRDLKVGDFVVHVDNGIGMFVGLKQIGIGDSMQEFLELRYAGEDKLFVPVERLDLVQKFTGASKPPIDRLGGASWERAKSKVKKAMRDMAEELLKLYAARKAVPGHAFAPDSHWQQEFEDAFEYDLTIDQTSAITDIKKDMETPTPMDRLLCGDVGYGKTEVAMRAAFKAVMDGKQVAFLAPTTVLAFQHQKTLKERFAGFPVRIDMVSRFRSKAEQTATLTDLEAGKVDLIVGTHRLLSKDVTFRDLGLLVVDEEQRFGVAHKEKIKQMKKKVDVLTMSATPIPRTLNMSLIGIRDMSIIETPPKDRLSIQTNVVKFDQHVIGTAIRTELARGGQVYFVHNRVESIFSIGDLVQRLVPEARVVVAHGQMDEEALERAMFDFVAKKFDVLLATTIVENGLDIPNANTIIINRADRYGLSQLYQLRGRVGRSDRAAYAYLLIPPEDNLSPDREETAGGDQGVQRSRQRVPRGRARPRDPRRRQPARRRAERADRHRRLRALHEAPRTDRARAQGRGDRGRRPRDGQPARGPEDRRVVRRRHESAPDALPQGGGGQARRGNRSGARRGDRQVRSVAGLGPEPGRLRTHQGDGGSARDRHHRPGRPHRRLKVQTAGEDRSGAARGSGAAAPRAHPRPACGSQAESGGAGGSGLGAGKAPERAGPPASPKAPVPSPKKTGKYANAAPSWWVARAREGEVKPGFTKADILRPAKEDPRAPGGVFERVGALLSDLLDRR